MNYDQPRQLKDTGLWRYTRQNDDHIFAVGYCAMGCDGHDTPDEARAHYRLYLLDNHLSFLPGPEHPRGLRRCEAEGCDTFTAGSVHVGEWYMWHVCETHQTREVVERLMPTVGDSVHS